MKVQDDAPHSAKHGKPYYKVIEEDRDVTHIMSADEAQEATIRSPHGLIAVNALLNYLGLEPREPTPEVAALL